MLVWFAIMDALKRSARDLKELEGLAPKRLARGASAAPGHPAKFATYRDPNGKFELAYPAQWELQAGSGVFVRSKKLSTFAGVEVQSASSTPWKDLEAAVAKSGGSLDVQKREAGPPKHLRGTLQLGPTRFSWNAYAYERGDETVTLSMGNVIDVERGTKIERYEDKVLEAIRREFRVTAAV